MFENGFFLALLLLAIGLAAIGGVLAAFAAYRVLGVTRDVAEKVNNAERRLQLTQLQLLTESVLSEAFFIDQLVGTLKKRMIEDAINNDQYRSKPFEARLETIDTRKAEIQPIINAAEKRLEMSAASELTKLDNSKLTRLIQKSELQLVKLRRMKKYFEKKMEAYLADEQFFGDDTLQ
ncbi:MAG: hypothetical protein AAF434_06890 [Pseudomonadota bacterium]